MGGWQVQVFVKFCLDKPFEGHDVDSHGPGEALKGFLLLQTLPLGPTLQVCRMRQDKCYSMFTLQDGASA